jgi:hypothetical protein
MAVWEARSAAPMIPVGGNLAHLRFGATQLEPLGAPSGHGASGGRALPMNRDGAAAPNRRCALNVRSRYSMLDEISRYNKDARNVSYLKRNIHSHVVFAGILRMHEKRKIP